MTLINPLFHICIKYGVNLWSKKETKNIVEYICRQKVVIDPWDYIEANFTQEQLYKLALRVKSDLDRSQLIKFNKELKKLGIKI